MLAPNLKSPPWRETLFQQKFTFSYFEFVYRAAEHATLPPFKGSTLRGGFGHAFRRVCCTMNNQECRECMLNKACPYAYIFETPMVDGLELDHYADNLPHPFIIEPPESEQTTFRPGDEMSCGLVLVGKSVSYIPYFVYTFDQMGRLGLGKGGGRFELTTVYAYDDLDGSSKTEIYNSKTQVLNGNFKIWNFQDLCRENGSDGSDKIELRITTPLRIIQKGNLMSQIPFSLFLRNLLRRISLLGRIHCGCEWDLPYRDIINQGEETVHLVDSRLAWKDWERYSNRQKQKMKMGGVVGTVTYEGDLAPYLPLIYLGQFTRLGKNTTFGLGRYRVV